MKRYAALLLSLFISLFPALAFAHIGADAGIHHESAFLTGLTHPFTGLDHMAAMLMVGVWSMLAFREARVWAAPASFAAMLAVGGLIGFSNSGLALVEPMIAASLIVLGLMVGLKLRLPVTLGATLVGAFAIFHGIAHGSELPAQQALTALSGMLLGTLILHLAGMGLGRFVIGRREWLPRLAGAAVALFGLSLLAA